MQALDHDHTIYTTPNAGDDSLLVRFYTGTEKDQAASLKEGRPIYKDVEFIDIRIPGSKDNVVVRPVRPQDMQRFPRHYAMFKQRAAADSEQFVGTPLEMWPILTKSQVEELKFFNIKSVEQLAGASDAVGQKFMGFNEMKRKAKVFIEAAASNAPLLQMQEALDNANAQIAALTKRLEAVEE